MKEIIIACISGLVTLAVCLINNNQQNKEVQKISREETEVQLQVFKESVKSLLKNQMLVCANNVATKGYIDITELETFNDMYANYKALKGNGTMETVHKRINNMKIKYDDGNN